MHGYVKQRINRGIVFAIVIIFLELVGFTDTINIMIGKLAGINRATEPVYLILFLILIGFWNGTTRKSKDEHSLKILLLSGMVSGLTTGILVGLFAYLLGSINAQGVDLRTYLPQQSNDTIRLFLFRQNAFAGGLSHLILFSITGFLGGLIPFYTSRALDGANFRNKITGIYEQIVHHPIKSRFVDNKYARYGMYLALIVMLFILPRQVGSYWNYILGTVGIYILLGLGLNIIVGFSGQLVLGYVAFFAIGAYTFALLSAPVPHDINMNFWMALGFGVLAATLTGVLLGLPILNLRGDYLAIVTLGFGEIIRNLIRSDLLTPLTLGPRGVRQIAEPTLFGRAFSSDVEYMYIILFLVILLIFITHRIQNSRVGRAWLAIKDDQTVSQANGVNTYRYKLLALAFGAAFAGLAGVIFAARNQFTGPEDHVLMVSINVLSLVIVGGMGSIPGVILGSFALKGLPEILRDFELYRMLAFGALLVIMMIVRPEGLWPTGRPFLEKARKKPDADLNKEPGQG